MNQRDDEQHYELQRLYLKESVVKIDMLNLLLKKLKSYPKNRTVLADFNRIIHGLRGSGASYGFPKISEIASDLGEQLDAILESEDEFDLKKLGLFKKIRSTIEDISSTFKKSQESLYDRTQDDLDFLGKYNDEEESSINILLITPDAEIQDTIRNILLDHKLYRLTVADSAKSSREILKQHTNFSLIIIEVKLSDGNGYELCKELRKQNSIRKRSIMFLTDHDQFSDRINALRAGGDDYLVKPIHPFVFFDKLERLLEENNVRLAKKIVVLDDDQDIVRVVESHLSRIGCHVIGLTNPSKILEVIKKESPDLIILDVLLPGVDGYELCRMIRQDEKFSTVPIIFLTVKNKIEDRIHGLNTGADDYITKPFSPDELVARVSAHLARKEILLKMATTDGLTGIRNHRYFQDRLYGEILSMKRNSTALSLIMVDIDNFKDINDKYGHQTGDKILKSLSIFFKIRLRKTDLVARYGGEEFVLLLPNTKIKNGFMVVDEARMKFAEKEFESSHGDKFTVTFSAGVANFPDDAKEKDELIDVADQRLYLAKESGRNRVIMNGKA